MIKYTSSKQLTLDGFETPFEMKLDKTNRWVVLAEKLPWDSLASVYYRKMSSRMGAGTKDARLVIGALYIKHRMRLSDEDTISMIRENIYMQYFLGLPGYTYEKVFDPSLFVYIRRRLGVSEFNEFTDILESASSKILSGKGNASPTSSCKRPGKDGVPSASPKGHGSGASDSADGKPGNSATKGREYKAPQAARVSKSTAPADQPGSCVKLDEDGRPHKGDMLLDATACVADIKYPTDLDLLNDSRGKAELLIDNICKRKSFEKPRTYRQKARRDYLYAIKRRNLGKNKRRKAIKKQIQYLRRDIKYINDLLDKCVEDVRVLTKGELKYFWVIQNLLLQQETMYRDKTHSVDERMVSIHQPHVRPVPRGKARAKTEFGSKIDLAMHDGYGYIERFKWGAFNESEDLDTAVYNYYMRYGYFPSRVFIDKIYATRKNLDWLSSMHIQFVGMPLGKAGKEYMEKQKQLLKGLGTRNRVEGRFGLDKRSCDLGCVMARTPKTSESWIAASNFVANIMNFIDEVLFVFFRKLHYLGWNWLRLRGFYLTGRQNNAGTFGILAPCMYYWKSGNA